LFFLFSFLLREREREDARGMPLRNFCVCQDARGATWIAITVTIVREAYTVVQLRWLYSNQISCCSIR
jgi:hypothetical protein